MNARNVHVQFVCSPKSRNPGPCRLPGPKLLSADLYNLGPWYRLSDLQNCGDQEAGSLSGLIFYPI